MRKDPFNDNRFMAILALVCAIGLSVFVSQENQNLHGKSTQEFRTAEVTETLNDVPLELSSHDDSWVVSGLPKTVTVRIKGPRNIVNRTKKNKFVVKTEDITKLSPGRQSIQLLIENMPKEISYQITPSRVLVNLYRKGTATKEVTYQLDEKALAQGRRVKQVTIEPAKVEVIGDERLLERLDKVYVDLRFDQPLSESYTGKFKLHFADKDGNPLRLSSKEGEVTVTIEIEENQKSLPLNLSLTGQSDQYNYQAQITGPTSVTAYASQEILDNLTQLEVLLDVSGYTQSQTLLVPIQAPAGVSLSQNEVEVTLHVEEVLSPSSDEETSKQEDEQNENNHPEADSQEAIQNPLADPSAEQNQ